MGKQLTGVDAIDTVTTSRKGELDQSPKLQALEHERDELKEEIAANRLEHGLKGATVQILHAPKERFNGRRGTVRFHDASMRWGNQEILGVAIDGLPNDAPLMNLELGQVKVIERRKTIEEFDLARVEEAIAALVDKS